MKKITIDIEAAYDELKNISGVAHKHTTEVSCRVSLTGEAELRTEWSIYFVTDSGIGKWTDTYKTFDECITEVKKIIKESKKPVEKFVERN